MASKTGALAILFSLLLPVTALAATETIVPVLKVGDEAPEFTLKPYNPKDAGAGVISLGNLVGSDSEDPTVKVVLVSFMASWCGPCIKELPFLQAMQEKYKGQGLRVLLVSIDKDEAGQAAVKKLIEQHKVTVPVLMDRFNFVAKRWLGEKSPLPSVFLVDKKGAIAMATSGYGEDASTFLEGKVKAALGPPAIAGDVK